jgi:peroxiredoxin
MALTESRDLSLGTACPDFRLRSVDGKSFARDDFKAKPVLVVMFICNH